MTDHDDVQHRAHHQPDPDDVILREDAADDGTITVRMPLASTGEVRNEGDDPLSRDAIEGLASQIEERSVPVFLDHGSNRDLGSSRYSAIGKVGEWRDAEIETRDGADELVADARLMDPETLPAATGAVREALATLKSQVERGIPLSSSIGWREDEDFPGGNDLMEGSIVGIPADPRTSQDAPTAIAARALDADDVDEFERRLEELRAVVMAPNTSDDQGGNAHDSVTDDTDTNDSGDEPDDTQESDDVPDQEEFRSEMLEMQRTQTETLNTLAEAIREDDEDDDSDDEDDDDDEEGDGEDEKQASKPEEQQSIEVGDEELTADDIRDLRTQLDDADPDADTAGDDDGGEGDAEASTDDQTDSTHSLLRGQ